MPKVELRGRRLLLRELTASDAPAVLEAVDASREALKRRLRWAHEARTEADELRFIERAAGEAARDEAFVWGAFEARSSRFAGVVGLTRDPASEGARLSLWVRSDRAGKGYATEAGRLAVRQAFSGLALRRLYARIEPANRAARKVLKRLGFRYEGCLREDRRLNGRWIDQECWGLLRTEWKK